MKCMSQVWCVCCLSQSFLQPKQKKSLQYRMIIIHFGLNHELWTNSNSNVMFHSFVFTLISILVSLKISPRIQKLSDSYIKQVAKKISLNEWTNQTKRI